MESMKHFYKWYYSLSETDREKQRDNSKLAFPYNSWDMNYHLFIGDFELLLDIDDIANELEYLNYEDISDIEKEQLVEMAWKIYD